MIKACLQTHKGTPRGTSRCRRSPNNSLPCLFSRPSQELSAHQRPISTRSGEDKSNMVIQLTASEKGSPCLVLPRAVPVESLFQCLSMKPTMMGQPFNLGSYGRLEQAMVWMPVTVLQPGAEERMCQGVSNWRKKS